MDEKRRICPFIKNPPRGNKARPDRESMAYPYFYLASPDYAVVLDMPYNGMPFNRGIPVLSPPVVRGCSGHPIEAKIVRVDNEGNETEVLFDSNKNHGAEDIIGQGQKTKKQAGEFLKQSLDETCKSFAMVLFSLIQEKEILVSAGKDCYEQELETSYGYEKGGYIYLTPQKAYSFTAKHVREAGKEGGIPTSKQLQCYLYRVNILDREEGKGACYTKKITIRGKRERHWCLKKKEMAEFMQKHEGKGLDIAPSEKKSKN